MNSIHTLNRYNCLLIRNISHFRGPISNRQFTTNSSIWSQIRNDQKTNREGKQQTEYVVKFKQDPTVGMVFKDLYSLYGPLYVVCHLGFSAVTLGLTTALAYSSLDIAWFLEKIHYVDRLSENSSYWAEKSGTFLIAYAMYKLTLPVRIGLSVLMTKQLAPRLKWAKKSKD